MPGANTPTTDREKAALLAYRLGIIPDAKTAYIAAEDKAAADVAAKSINSYVSRWINSDRVKQIISYFDRLLADRDADARERGREEEERRKYKTGKNAGDNERTDGKPGARLAKEIDFYDPANQRTQINRIIREAADDPKTQLDAIKAIQQTQRDDKQAARDQKQVRSYLPLRCNDCPLMIKARQETTK